MSIHQVAQSAVGGLKVLVAEDDPVSRHRLQIALSSWGYQVTRVCDGEAALREMGRPDHPVLVILDWSMPKLDGLQVCRTVRDACTDRYVYIILLTGHDGDEEVLAGFDAGADDYITKPFNTGELKARVRSGARIIELQRELIAAREQVRERAMRDPLTGLLTRGAFFEVHERELLKTRRTGVPLSLIIADLDHFKAINDRYGHPAGDDVLREAARRLASSVRRSDAVGRYGGEEFIALASACTMEDALALGEKIRRSISAEPFQTCAGLIGVTTSVGVASTTGTETAEQLLRTADKALYRAKAAGRNTVAGDARAA